jgi:hypothetical protein
MAVSIGDDGKRNSSVADFVDILDPLVVRGEIIRALYGLLAHCQIWIASGRYSTRPIICTPRASNSGFNFAKAPSSVVQTGVKSAGCENNTVHFPVMNLWKSRSPCVVFA